MGLFGKAALDELQDLLGQVKGSVYIFDTKFDKKNKRLYVAYGTGAPSDKELTPFSGIAVLVRVLEEDDLAETAETSIVKIKGKELKVAQNAARIFWEVIEDITAELEARLQKILSSPGKWGFVVKSADLVNPFEIDSKTAIVRIEVASGDRRYQDELTPYHIFYSGTKVVFHNLLLKMLQHFCSQMVEIEGKEYIELTSKAVSGSIPKFLQAMSDSGVMDVLLEDESGVRLRLEEMQKLFLASVKKQGTQLGLDKNYLIDDKSEFKLTGLELAYTVFIILGAPGRLPISILTWVLDDLADEIIKDRLLELPLERFYGDEEKLFGGMVEDKTEDQMMETINLGFHTNLYEMKVDENVKNFKVSIQKSLLKYDFGQEKDRKRKAENAKRQKAKNKKDPKEKKVVKQVALKAFALFPAFDSAEKELRIREFAKEITVYIVSQLEEEIDQDKFISVSQSVLNSIKNMISLHIIWTSNGWVHFQPGTEDEIREAFGKEVYRHIVDWHKMRERILAYRWGLNGEYDLISNGDIFHVFKKDNLSGVISELDHLFSIKRLIIRRSQKGFQAMKRRRQEGEDQPATLQMLEPLVLKPLKMNSGLFPWVKMRAHQMIQKSKGWVVVKGDFLRNIDLLDDLMFFYNSRFGLEIPNSIIIEEILTDLQALSTEGHIKRYLLNNQPVTAVPIKAPENLTDRKTLLLQMVPVVANRYK